MIQIVTVLEGLYFSGSMPDVEVNCYDNLKFTLSRDEKEILFESYAANDKSRVWIRGLGKIFASDLGMLDGMSANYVMTFSDGSTTATKTIRVILGEAPMQENAVTFVANNFLTMLDGAKHTHLWAREILSLYTTVAVPVTLEVVKRDGTRVNAVTIRTISDVNECVEIDVSPEKLGIDATVQRYIIKAGDRMMVYMVDVRARREAPEFLIRNSFGCREGFVSRGLVERENVYESSTGYIRDMLFRFETKEIKKFTANTGVLNEEQSDWVEDLLVSSESFLVMGSDLIPITFTDAKVVRTNAPDELISFDFQYQLSQPNRYGAGRVDIKRIFDDTFDYTFH